MREELKRIVNQQEFYTPATVEVTSVQLRVYTREFKE
jgi:hypothetical protein